jgi:hypothetical protein
MQIEALTAGCGSYPAWTFLIVPALLAFLWLAQAATTRLRRRAAHRRYARRMANLKANNARQFGGPDRF